MQRELCKYWGFLPNSKENYGPRGIKARSTDIAKYAARRAMRYSISAALAILTSVAALGAEQPVRALYIESRQALPMWEHSFTPIPVNDLMVYLMVGDISKTFDSGAKQPDATIMPTNTRLDLKAAFPTTQAVLIKRIEADSAAIDSLNNSVKNRIPREMLMAIDTFPVELWPNSQSSSPREYPRYGCFIATDEPVGGSIGMRDLFYQKLIARGIENCLVWLDEKGAKSVVLPLIGAASGGTYGKRLESVSQIVLLRCRMINSLSGIGLGVNGFLKKRKSIKEIGIVQWDSDLEKQFPPAKAPHQDTPERAAWNKSIDKYGDLAQTFLTKALSGESLKPGDLPKEDGCNEIFGFKSNGRRD